MGEWMPIDSAPKDGTRILVGWLGRDQGFRVSVAEWRERELWPQTWWQPSDESLVLHILHPYCWMPLPPPPSLPQE